MTVEINSYTIYMFFIGLSGRVVIIILYFKEDNVENVVKGEVA